MSVKQTWTDLKSALAPHVPIRTLNVVSALFAGAAGLAADNWHIAWMLLFVSTIMVGVATWATGRNYDEVQQFKDEAKTRGKEIDSLKDTVESLKKVIDDSQNGDCKATKIALDRMLNTFAKRILINVEAEDDPSVRVTLYGLKPSPDGGHTFVPLARCSHSPHLERMGRKSYPGNEGFIQIVWEKGVYTWKSVSKTEKGRKTEFVNKFKMPMSTVEKLTMIPCSMAGIRLDDTDGEKLGLLILESDDEVNKNYVINSLDKLNKDQGMLMCVSEAIGSLGPYLEVLAK